MRREQPDRVPVCPRGLDVLSKLYGLLDWRKRLQACKDFGFDFTDFFTIPMKPHPSVRIKEKRWDLGEYELVKMEYETPKGQLTQSERKYKPSSGKYVPNPLTTATVEEFLVKGPEDLEKLEYLYAVPEEEAIETFRNVKGEVGEEGVPFGMVYSPTCLAVKHYGLENLLEASLQNPEFVRRLHAVYKKASIRQTELLLEIGAEVIYMDTTYTSAELWSPKLFKEVVLEAIKEQIALAHEAGRMFAYFLCGYCRPFVDILRESGIDVISPVAPPPTGDVDLAEAKTLLGKGMCLWGGINVSYDMRTGTPESIRRKVQEAIQKAGTDGGYILGFESALYEWVPMENVIEFFKAAKEFGKYPLS